MSSYLPPVHGMYVSKQRIVVGGKEGEGVSQRSTLQRSSGCVCECRFLTAPSCIKRGTRGAKPGVPHRRRQQLPTATMTSSDTAAGHSCVTSSATVTSPTYSTPHDLPPLSPAGLACSPGSDVKFSFERLMMSAACLSSSSSSSSPTSCYDYDDDVLPPRLLSAPPISHLLVDNAAY